MALRPVADLAGRQVGRPLTVLTFTTQPVVGGGAQLFPCSHAMGTPQTFPMSLATVGFKRSSSRLLLGISAAAAANQPRSARFRAGVCPLRGFHHWFSGSLQSRVGDHIDGLKFSLPAAR
jgi:hypothetical protein